MAVKHHDFSFTSGDETLVATIDYIGDTVPQPTILSLHGGGPEARERIAPLATYLAQHGHSILRFDHSGWGQSSGDRATSTLHKRVTEAVAATQFMQPDKPYTLIGTSMGGHIALELLAHLDIANLILFCPAAYAAEAYTAPFGPTFTNIIRRPDSWKDAVIFNHLKKFTGGFIHIISDTDPIIPLGVTHSYQENIAHTHCREFITLPDAPHNLSSWLQSHPDQREIIFNKILELLTVIPDDATHQSGMTKRFL